MPLEGAEFLAAGRIPKDYVFVLRCRGRDDPHAVRTETRSYDRCVCPWRVRGFSPLTASQTVTVLSSVTAMIHLPSGL